jgi:hypothetical protein
LLTVYQFVGARSSTAHLSYEAPKYNLSEEFDPSLGRLNSVKKFIDYCDSVYSEKLYTSKPVSFEKDYPEIASSVVGKRFYHGYSLYGFKSNYMAMFLSKVSVEGLNAIVIPDDILEYPFAACSQQSIVLMEVLRNKGFATRKVGFQSKKYGHFCFEVYYNGGWHFYDPDMEPNAAVLNAYNRPGIDYLARHKDILLKAYAQHPSDLVLDLFPNYFYGAVNKFPAPNAMLFHKITKTFSYTLWAIFLAAFIVVRRKYLRMSNTAIQTGTIKLREVHTEIPMAYFPKYSA